MSEKNENKVTVIIADLEGNKKTKHYASIAHARKFAIENIGSDFVINERFAESTTNNKLCIVKNATLQELLVDPLPQGVAGSGTGKSAKRKACRNDVLALIGIYIDDPDQCEELMVQLEDGYVIYPKQAPKSDDEE